MHYLNEKGVSVNDVQLFDQYCNLKSFLQDRKMNSFLTVSFMNSGVRTFKAVQRKTVFPSCWRSANFSSAFPGTMPTLKEPFRWSMHSGLKREIDCLLTQREEFFSQSTISRNYLAPTFTPMCLQTMTCYTKSHLLRTMKRHHRLATVQLIDSYSCSVSVAATPFFTPRSTD